MLLVIKSKASSLEISRACISFGTVGSVVLKFLIAILCFIKFLLLFYKPLKYTKPCHVRYFSKVCYKSRRLNCEQTDYKIAI